MNAKKTVKKFLAPNWVPMIIALLIPFFNALALIVLLFNYLPRQFRANKNVKNLEENGKLEQAAAEILSGGLQALHERQGRAVCTLSVLQGQRLCVLLR